MRLINTAQRPGYLRERTSQRRAHRSPLPASTHATCAVLHDASCTLRVPPPPPSPARPQRLQPSSRSQRQARRPRRARHRVEDGGVGQGWQLLHIRTDSSPVDSGVHRDCAELRPGQPETCSAGTRAHRQPQGGAALFRPDVGRDRRHLEPRQAGRRRDRAPLRCHCGDIRHPGRGGGGTDGAARARTRASAKIRRLPKQRRRVREDRTKWRATGREKRRGSRGQKRGRG
mmetsp:Transcript_25687/g.41061  ORF Transcript_25687/g.41061 Transcript_25687/m.41061 type:complete len:230 (-) Transcript_25687:432-1121(-)